MRGKEDPWDEGKGEPRMRAALQPVQTGVHAKAL